MMLANSLNLLKCSTESHSNTPKKGEYPCHRAGVTVFFLPAYPFLSVTPSQPLNHAGYSAFAKRHRIDDVTDTEGGKGDFPLTLSFCDVTGVTGVTASNGAGCSGNVCLFGDVTGVTRLQKHPFHGYPTLAPAKSGVGRENPQPKSAHQRPHIDGAIFVPVSYGGCAWASFGLAGFPFLAGFSPRVQSPPNPVRRIVATPIKTGASPMTKLRLSLAHVRAKAHRKMAFAALHADSSLSVRLKRYQHHIDRARALEAKEVRP